MWWSKRKVVATVLLAAGLLTAALVGTALHTPAAPPDREAQAPPAAPAGAAPAKEAAALKTFQLGNDVGQVVWSPDGKLMASLASRSEKRKDDDEDARDWYSTVKVWDARTGQEIVSLGELKDTGLVALGFAPDNTTLALSFFRQIDEGAKVELWDARKGELKRTIEMDYGRIVPKFAFSPDGKALAVLYAGDKGRKAAKDDLNGGLRLFDADKGKVIRSVRGHKHLAISLAFSPDGKLLATGGSQHDLDVRLWDTETGKEVRVIDVAAHVPALAFSPDGKVLATGQGDGRVGLQEVATGKVMRELKGATDSTFALAFSPDGRLLATAGPVEADGKRTNETRLWDAGTGKLLRSWQNTATSFAFAPDGKTLAILGRDGAVRLWELKTPPAAADAKADYGFGTLIDQPQTGCVMRAE
jgi:WD40 repeat protein